MLIVRFFGYINGCIIDGELDMTKYNESTCIAGGGTWRTNLKTVNPNAPNGSAVAWLGAFLGSIIRPVGGYMADKFGGAKMSQAAIVFTSAAVFGQGALVQVCDSMADPTKYYGAFVFLFICLFLGTGKTTFVSFLLCVISLTITIHPTNV